MFINDKTFRQWWDIFHADVPLTELRLFSKSGRKRTASGYYTDCNAALEAIHRYPEELGIYAPINSIQYSCYGRYQHDKIVDNPEATTSDKDIEGREWILIDLDSKRPTGCNASDAELEQSKQVMRQIGIFLRDQGFSAPVIAMSGNGWHLYYKVQLKNDDETCELVKKFLQVLDMHYSNSSCDVDLSVFNASRIAKIIGSKSNKGSDTADRPQRESYFVKVPDNIEPTDRKFIEKVARMYPEEEKPDRFNGYSSEFNIEEFISRNGIRIAKRARFSGGERLILAECPFDPNHKAPDAAIFVMNNGAIGFRCLHNSCSHYTWRDVRLHFEPDAYSRKERDAFLGRRSYYNSSPKPLSQLVPENSSEGKIWYSMSDIACVDPNAQTYIPTGILNLDYRIGGFALGDVTLLSGRAGSGKSSLLNTIMLNVVDRGYKVAVWSGELQPARFQSWLDQAAAGKNFVQKKAGEYEDWYYCPRNIAEKINKWLGDKIVLRNNDYGSKWSQLFQDIQQVVQETGVQLLLLDNLASLNLDAYDGERNDKQSRFIADLKDFAKQTNIHIVLVAHPRKEQGNGLLRMESISGAFDLVNLCDNVLLAHRVGSDFERRAKEYFGAEKTDTLLVYSEIIEVAKNRSHGAIDTLVGLHFEKKSRRFQNSFDEYVVYGWQEDDQELSPTNHYNIESREIYQPQDFPAYPETPDGLPFPPADNTDVF